MSSPNQLSFLPDDYLEGKRQRRTNVVCGILLVAILGSVLAGFGSIESSLRKAESEHAEIDKQYADAAKRIEQVRQMQEKQRKMAHQAELTASLLEKVPRSFLLAEITNAMPAGVSLMDVRLESRVRASQQAAATGKTQFEMKKAAMDAAGKKPTAPAAQAKLYDVSMKVMGVADNDVQVAQFMARLNQSKLLKDVNLVISDEYTLNEAKMRKFEIDLTVDPAAEIQPGINPRNSNAAVELK